MSSMMKKIFEKNLLVLSAIAVAVTGLSVVATLDDAEAKGKTGIFQFKCTESEGSFFDPGATGGLFFSSAGHANCTGLGPTNGASVTTVTTIGTNCINLATTVDAYVLSKKGFITFSVILEQCFFDSTGAVGSVGAQFCGVTATNTFTSTVTGTYTITGGVITGNPVTGGTGTVSSAVDHCTAGVAPFANSVKTTLTGTIVYGAIVKSGVCR